MHFYNTVKISHIMCLTKIKLKLYDSSNSVQYFHLHFFVLIPTKKTDLTREYRINLKVFINIQISRALLLSKMYCTNPTF